MKFDLGPKVMDIGTFEFNYVRALMVAGTGAADIGECSMVGHRIKEGDTESWVREWAVRAPATRCRPGKRSRPGTRSSGPAPITARRCFPRSSATRGSINI